MSSAPVKALILFVFSVLVSRADVVVGSLVYFSDATTGFQTFEVFNETGSPIDNFGCDAANNIPVCTPLNFENSSLTLTFADMSTKTLTPSGGFSFLPGPYIYGAQVGDDPNQSFLIDPALSIASATFQGTLSSAQFQITDGTNESTFVSDGTFIATLDLSGGPPAAAADIITFPGATSAVPEPGSVPVLIVEMLIGGLFLRQRFRRN
jgi:hypothetical protein